MMPSARIAVRCAAVSLLAFATAAGAQQVVRPPLAQYWMDVATHSMAGMPEMPGLPSMPSFFWAAARPAAAITTATPAACRPAAGSIWRCTRARKPSGSEAAHAIPPGMEMGASLPLVPLLATAGARTPGESSHEPRERPSGRLLIYWGCGETVRAGQPRVIDLASGDPQAFGRAFAGRYAPDRGARATPGYSLWPNEKSRAMVPRGASLAGDHAISGDGVPASMKFALGQAQDFMPSIQLTSSGALAGSVALQWAAVPNARAYYLHAMASIGKDMVLWSSAETPDSGMGLFDYLSNATIDRWVTDKALLPASTTRCAVPKGIFASGRDDGAMLRMIAWGGELNLAHPPRPSDVRKPWEPEWTARVRVKATTMAMLGMDIGGSNSAPEPAARQAAQGDAPAGQSGQGGLPSLPGLPEAGRAIDAIKGLFGR